MADDFFNVLSSTEQIKKNYEQFKDKYVDKDKELISQETFLKLLVAEMSNQDPLEPTSNTEFISQLAQFSSMQYMQDSSKYSMATYASSLVGKTVTASKQDGPDLVVKTGVVEKVVYKNNSYTVTINGEDFDIGKVTSVVADGSGSGGFGSNTLSDRIARAAAMIGKYAFVKTGEKTEDGKDEMTEGFIESITVKDGEINIVVGGKPYSMESIDEITDAWIVEDPEDPENPDAPKDPENTGSTGETVDAGKPEDVPDLENLSEDEQELYEQLQSLIDSMS
ncbi:MAG: hypothetical protein K2N56_08610 [Oscillospiraceae bacterium]|nr:hypothetical protein [Oscillospiraceae bacterium]